MRVNHFYCRKYCEIISMSASVEKGCKVCQLNETLLAYKFETVLIQTLTCFEMFKPCLPIKWKNPCLTICFKKVPNKNDFWQFCVAYLQICSHHFVAGTNNHCKNTISRNVINMWVSGNCNRQ